MKLNKILIVFLIVLNVSLLLKLFLVFRPYNENIICNSGESYAAKQLQLYLLIESGKKINPNTLLYGSQGSSILLSDLITKDTICYFVHIPSGGCHSCLSSVLEDIDKLSFSLKNRLHFFTSYMDDHELKELENQYSIEILNLKNNSFGFLSEREQKYFVFNLENDFIAKQFHLLDGSLNEFTRQYVKYCRSYINTKRW